ncbi:fatty acid synthase alpha subunit Lsd1 [Coemansia erecta]|nr:fatty acid synthase alpha subunit Lsd1 [Coemansia erecta]
MTVVNIIHHGQVSIALVVAPESADKLLDLASSFEQTELPGSPQRLELFALFLEHCAQKSTELALVVLDALVCELRASNSSIHAEIQKHELSEPRARTVLRAYYSLWNAADARPLYQHAATHHRPALLSSTPEAQLLAVFGGQRGTGSCLEEAQWLFDVYRPLLSDFVQRVSVFFDGEARDSRISSAYPNGLDVYGWLTRPASVPNTYYMESMPVMLPVIGLTQLMQVMVLFKTLFMLPGELAQQFKGIAIAAVFSMMTDEQSFDGLSTRILGLQMLVGALPQLEFPYYRLNPRLTHDCAQLRDSVPYPMVLIRGVSRALLEQLICTFNHEYDAHTEHAYLAVANTKTLFIVTGTTLAVAKFAAYACAQSADEEDQTRVPFAERRPVIQVSYLQITAPYHCTLLDKLVDPIYDLAQKKHWNFEAADMQVCVRACDDGHDIRNEIDVTRYLITSMCVLPVDWPQAIDAPGTTHIVDFGPGGFSGFGQLAFKNVEGRGIPVICAGALLPQSANSELGTAADLYQSQAVDVITTPNWLAEYGPRLVRTAHDQQVHIDTRMSRVLGMPTVMVAGMTPTTANEKFVAAINQAGYHAELAGGGMHSESDMVSKINALVESTTPGQGITLNCIYVNPKQWSFQIPALLRLRSKGSPIVGLCIGGGVPSFDKALEIIGELRAAGIRHMSFKPSTASVIRQVVQIARASQGFPIVLQWTGGRGGGHHSFEDFHQPILDTYAAIRSCDNIVLVAGSGFGDADGSLPYITGDWSVSYGRAPMPFDGILLGSRVMVAQEAGTSPAAKQLIVDTTGLSDADWHQTYDGSNGGITTITSEYGEFNHVLATRSSSFIRFIHKTILSQPRDKHKALLLAHKDEIIAGLNSDYVRPWFGRKSDGRVVDLEQMTYAEVISRAVELMYVNNGWVHKSQHKIVVEFIERCERRMCGIAPDTPIMVRIGETDPTAYTDMVAKLYPEVATELIRSEDAEYFAMLCKRRGQKPPLFMLDLGEDFGAEVQKDSIWQSEHLEAVVGEDPQRVGIQQGPVAARYSTRVDEPVKDILDGIYHGHIASLVERVHGGDASKIPVVEYIGEDPVATDLPATVVVRDSDTERVFVLPDEADQLPDSDTWLQVLAGPCKSWLRAWLTAPVVVRGTKYANNVLPRLLRPRPGRMVTVSLADGIPQTLDIVSATGLLEFKLEYNDGIITQSVFQPTHAGIATLCQQFLFHPASLTAPITYLVEQDYDNVQRLFEQTWVDNAEHPTEFFDVTEAHMVLRSNGMRITEDLVREFCQSVGNHSCYRVDGVQYAPLDFIYIAGSPNTLRLLTSSAVGDGQLAIVHLSNHVELVNNLRLLKVGDRIDTAVQLTGLANSALGKVISILGTVSVRGELVATVKSEFLSNGYFVGFERSFKHESDRIKIRLPSMIEIAVLETKEWYIYREDAPQRLEPDSLIEFCLDSEYRFKSEHVYSSIVTTGTVTIQGEDGERVHIADVDFQWAEARQNLAIKYLRQFEVGSGSMYFDNVRTLQLPGSPDEMCIVVPDSNDEYARISSDRNPIHVNQYIAEIAELPAAITHGQYTGAATRTIVEKITVGGRPERFRAYRTEFTGMVFPADRLKTELAHIGMKHGRMLIEGQTLHSDNNTTVMKFAAEIEQPLTAYVFTGQGSQEVGMGMALYESSPAARAIWNRASQHMSRTFGLPLFDLVRTNPQEHTVYFEDEFGESVLRSYLAVKSNSLSSDSLSYTVASPTGVLNATQITQPAMVAFACAAMADMRANGLIQEHALFAGHSLGELCALATLGNVFKLEDILDIALYRGLIMQSAVARDEQGRSEFGMAAVYPSRISKGFSESALQDVIGAICKASPGLLQIVNYNVRGQQYVASGTLTNLAVLRLVLDRIASSGLPSDVDIGLSVSNYVSEVLAQPINAAPVRGKATIPLQGIDVPFHSLLLLDSVPAFRNILNAKLCACNISLDSLYCRYIPNLTAVPFEVTRGYFEMVHMATGSPVASEILSTWTDDALEDPTEKKHLAVALLVELLAYQLAAPVQWIKTQDRLFGTAEIERMVEVGPSPVLCGMAAKTLANASHATTHPLLLHVERDRDELYYTNSSEEPDIGNALPEPPVEVSKVATSQEPPSTPPPQLTVSSGAPIDDTPLQAVDTIRAIIAFKTKQPLSNISAQQSIKTISAGKSILQNEILGDLQKEFGTRVPDKPEDMSLQELGSAIGTSSALGKCTQPLVARMISSKMPGGFSLPGARAVLQNTYGLGPQRQDALLLVALTMEPATRLSSEAEAGAWLDAAAQAYAAHLGIAYSAAAAASAGSAAQGPAVSSAELQKVRQREIEHIQQQIEVLARYAGIDLRESGREAEVQQANALQLQNSIDDITAEFGDELIAGVRPQFDAHKARRYDSFWNWARQDAFDWIQQTVVRCVSGAVDESWAGASEQARLQQLQNRADPALVQMLAGTVKVLCSSNDAALEPAVQLAQTLHGACKNSLDRLPVYREFSRPMQPKTCMSLAGKVSYTETPRLNENSFTDYVEHMSQNGPQSALPMVHLCKHDECGSWTYDPQSSAVLFDRMLGIAREGLSFAGRTALVTGCGRGSIGAEIVSSLLMGGAKVLATTSSYSRKTTLFFEDMYRQHGSRGSELIVVPFNQGSVQDIDRLVRFVLGTGAGDLGWNLDYVFPFAALSDIGSTVTNLGSRSELAQRVMLTNLLRLLGSIKLAKEKRSSVGCGRPTLVVLPLSPNHGTFGGDGLYGESKLALETLFNRWNSESWKGHVSIAGAVIGWTRGTGLMSANNMVAQEIENHGVRTYSTREMAFNILGLLNVRVTRVAHRRPVWADFSGGIGRARNLDTVLRNERLRIELRSGVLQRVVQETASEYSTMLKNVSANFGAQERTKPLAQHKQHFPAIKRYGELQHLHHLQGMVNLDKVVVVTGYGEVSTHGNAETRWEIEAFGELTMEGCIELAWVMGLIRHHNGPLTTNTTGQHHIGWVDAKSNEPIDDADIKPRYHEYIMAHTGIRLIEPSLVNDYDPAKKQVLREVQIEHDMDPFDATYDEATAFKQSNGDKVDIWENVGSDSWSVRFLKGALIRVPMAVSATRLVAGLIPTGWDASRFGIPDDVIKQVDPVTLFMLVSTVEALIRSGITDAYELYEYIHVSQIGNTIGCGIGGSAAIQDVFGKRQLDHDLNSDIVQETFISTVQAWINMLLVSGSGPVKPSVGACATGVLSIDTAIECIQADKAKVMLAGGVDDFFEESSTEFANMGATSNAVEESANGCTPSEMSRPCTSTRGGFMEGQGGGVAVLMSATTAIEIGAPIYGIVAMSSTATDKQGSSVPAPGQGILTTARETNATKAESRLLDLNYRRRKLERQLQTLDAWRKEELNEIALNEESNVDDVEHEYALQRSMIVDAWGAEFWKRNPRISPLRGSLAVWGLTADDIGMASFHGTSTKANDKNESDVLNAQLRHLGRTPGHVVPAVCQKWLTGHPKGGAASLMLNGVLQCLRTGLVPGNRNADNIAAELKECDYVLYPSQTIQTSGIKAALLKSFGFGQVGGELLILHPDYALAMLEPKQLDAYNKKLEQRSAKSSRYWQDVLMGKHAFVQVKSRPPYTPDQEQSVYLDPLARAHFDPTTNEYKF